ncbi:4'-phosphopantetheinyl transferase family protein [Arthrobacter sp. Sr24]
MNKHSGGGLIRGVMITRAFELAAVDSSLFALLDAAERARADAIDKTTTRRDFLAGRVVQRLMAAEVLAVSPDQLVVDYTCPECGPNPLPSHGRPGYLLRGVPAAVSISLSRSHGWALVATVPGVGVPLGVDVQHRAQVGFEGFDDVALSPAEKSLLARVAPAAQDAWRANAWARKEALAKSSGWGLRTEPAHIPAFPEENQFGEGSVVTEVWELVPQDVGLPEGFAAAVAVRYGL